MLNILIGIIIMTSAVNSQTTVVNIATDSCEVYIGRGIQKYAHLLTEGIEPGVEGWLGNPHPIGDCKICSKTHTRLECIEKFKQDFHKKIADDPVFRKHLIGLKGKKLGCYCKPEDCHGDVIKQWLDHMREAQP